MARAKIRRRRRQHALPPWAVLLSGVALGGAATAVVYVVLSDDQAPAGARVNTAEKPAAPATRTAAPSKPRFDFYTILPEMEVVVPDPRDPTHDTPSKQAHPPVSYMLQAGSFRKFGEADRLKASLALLGIEADIQTVTIDDGDTWHRIRIGPYSDLRSVDKVRRQLHKNDIDTVLVQIRP